MRPIRLVGDEVTVPCGQCVECRLKQSREWAVRMMHEASLYEDNCFITLTYDDEHLPPYGSLDRRAFPLFMKRLRKEVGHVRYFHAGEYGERNGRPHYHACLFGYGFPDREVSGHRGSFTVYRSRQLERLWSDGLSEIGSLCFESAAYVSRYVMKKVIVRKEDSGRAKRVNVDALTGECHEIVPEYATMSRNPGIGAGWFDKYGCEVFPEDSVVMRGALQSPPRYYYRKLEMLNPEMAVNVKNARVRKLALRAGEEIKQRPARECIAISRSKLSERSL